MESTKKKNGLVALVIILIIIILGLVGFIVYNELNSSTNNNNSQGDDKEQVDNKDVDTTDYKYTMNVYKNQYGSLCSEANESCNIIAYTLKTETENAKIVGIEEYDFAYILYNDNGLKLYNVKTQKIVKTNLDTNYDSYELFKVDDNYLSASYCDFDNKTGCVYLVNVENGNIELKDKVKGGGNGYYSHKLNNNSFYILGSRIETSTIEKIYNNDKKLLFENTTDEIIYDEKYSFFKDNLYI